MASDPVSASAGTQIANLRPNPAGDGGTGAQNKLTETPKGKASDASEAARTLNTEPLAKAMESAKAQDSGANRGTGGGEAGDPEQPSQGRIDRYV